MEGPYDQKEFDLLIKNKIDIVFQVERHRFIERTNDFPKEIKVWIKIDTGMNRLGFEKEDEIIIIRYIRKLVKNKKSVFGRVIFRQQLELNLQRLNPKTN